MSQLGQFFEDMINQQKQIQNQAKAVDYMVKANPEMLDRAGIHPEEYKNYGARDKIALGQGFMQLATQEQMKAQIAREQAETGWYNQRSAESAGEGDALSAFARSLAPQLPGGGNGANVPPLAPPGSDSSVNVFAPSAPPAPPGASSAPGPGAAPNLSAAVMGAMANMGQTNPRMAGVMLGKLLPTLMGNGSEDLTPGIFKDPDTGAHFVYRGKQLLPAGYDPGKTNAGKAMPMTDPDGNLMGFSMTDIKGHSTFHPYKGNSVVKQMKDESGTPLDGFFMDSQGHALNTQSAMEKAGYEMTTDADGNPKLQLKVKAQAASAGPLPLPKTKAEMKVNQEYQTAQGIYTWDGKQLVKKK